MGFFDSDLATASISWNDARPGDSVTGIVITDSDGKAYVESNQTDIDTGAVLTYKDGSPRRQAVINLLSELRGWEFATDQFKEKAKDDDDIVDDGKRRLFVRGKSLTTEFKKGVKKSGLKDVVPGMTVTVKLAARKPIPDSKYKENIFEVTVTAPTPTTMAVVAQHSDSGGSLSAGSDDASDTDDSEPPF